jgi:hypothetical protein
MNIGEARPSGETADGVTKAASRRALGLRPNTKANAAAALLNRSEMRVSSGRLQPLATFALRDHG